MKNLTVWDALIAWRDQILNKDILKKSRTHYLSNMTKLIEIGLIDPQQPLAEFTQDGSKKNKLNEIENILSWPQSIKRSRKTLLRSFHNFSKETKIKKTPIEIPLHVDHRSLEMLSISELLSSNEDKAKSQYLTDKEINQFLLELRSINDRDFLVCRTMWELKCTIHQILNLKVGDYDQEEGVFKLNEFEGRFGNLRPDIKEPILKLCENKSDSDLIFCTDKGNSIHPAQIVRNMKLASKRAELPIIISPKIIYAHAQSFLKHYSNVDMQIAKHYGEFNNLKMLEWQRG